MIKDCFYKSSLLSLFSQSGVSDDGLLDSPGWTQFPNGLILEWGEWSNPTCGNSLNNPPTIYFPKQFLHQCFGVYRDNNTHLYSNVSVNFVISEVTNDYF